MKTKLMTFILVTAALLWYTWIDTAKAFSWDIDWKCDKRVISVIKATNKYLEDTYWLKVENHFWSIEQTNSWFLTLWQTKRWLKDIYINCSYYNNEIKQSLKNKDYPSIRNTLLKVVHSYAHEYYHLLSFEMFRLDNPTLEVKDWKVFYSQKWYGFWSSPWNKEIWDYVIDNNLDLDTNEWKLLEQINNRANKDNSAYAWSSFVIKVYWNEELQADLFWKMIVYNTQFGYNLIKALVTYDENILQKNNLEKRQIHHITNNLIEFDTLNRYTTEKVINETLQKHYFNKISK